MQEYERLERRARERTERQQKIANLKRAIKEQKEQAQNKGLVNAEGAMKEEPVIPKIDLVGMPPVKAKKENDGDVDMADAGADEMTDSETAFAQTLPPLPKMRAQMEAYRANNQALEGRVAALRSRSLEMEGQYRRIIHMCTGVDEAKVDEMLGNLLAAVESEPTGNADVGRLREFLRKADGA